MKNLRKQKRDKITDKILSTIYQPKAQTNKQLVSSGQPRLQNNFFISYNQTNNADLRGNAKRNSAIKNLNININFSGQSIQSPNTNVICRQKHEKRDILDDSESYKKSHLNQNKIKQHYIKDDQISQNFNKHAVDFQFRRRNSKNKSKNRYKQMSNKNSFPQRQLQTEAINKQTISKNNQRYSKKQFLNHSIEVIYSSNKKNKFKSLQKGTQQKKRKFRLFTLNSSNQAQSNQKKFKEKYKSIQNNRKQRSPASQRLSRSININKKKNYQSKSNNSSFKQLNLSNLNKQEIQEALESAAKFIHSKNKQYGYQSFKIQSSIQFKNKQFGLNKMEKPRRLLTYESLSKSSQKLKLLAIKQKSNLSSKELLIKKSKNKSQDIQMEFKQCQYLAQIASFQQSQLFIQKLLKRLHQNKMPNIKIYRDILQLKATNNFNLGQYSKCINVIDQIFKITRENIQSLDKPNKQLYIIAAISWNQLNNDKSCEKLDKAIQYLEKCSVQNPQWSQPYDFLGKIHYQNQFYQKAIQYFQQSLKVNQKLLKSNKYQVNFKQQQFSIQNNENKKTIEKLLCKRLKTSFNIVQCFKSMNFIQKAIKILQKETHKIYSFKSQGIQRFVEKGLIQLINLHYLQKQYQICFKSLQEYQSRFQSKYNEPQKRQNLKCQMIFMKAHIYYKTGHRYQSIMLLDQILPLVSSLNSTKITSEHSIKKQKQLLNNIVSHMIIIKIQQRDFYEASHLIQRCKYFNIDQNQLKIQKEFVFGVVQIMKRKINQGLQQLQKVSQYLSKLKQNQKKTQKSINQHEYFLLEIKKPTLQIQKVIQMYLAYGYFCVDNLEKTKASIQNQLLINKQNQNDQKKVESYFENSLNYNLHLCQGLVLLKQISDTNYKQSFQQALQHFNKALSFFQKPQPFFYLCLLNAKKCFILNNQQSAKSQNDVNLLQIQMELNINRCVNLVCDMNNNFSATIFYYRSLLYCYKKKWNLALSDIDQAIQRSEQNYSHYFYLKALILACCQNFKQAINDASVAISLDQKAPQNYLLRSKCLQIQGDGNQAFLDLQTYITLKPDDSQIHKYAGHLLFQNGAFEDAILAYSQGSLQNTGKSSNQVNFHVYLTRSKTYFLLGDFQNASKDMLQAFHLREQDKQYFFDYKMMCFLNQLISIMEKVQQGNMKQSEQIHKLQQLLQKLSTIKKQGSEFLQQKNGIQKKDENKKANKYFGKIFKQVEIHMFKFIILFYLKQYEQCIVQLNKCIKLKQRSFIKNNLKNLNQQEDEAQYEQQQNEKKMFINQMRYNLSIVYLKLKNFQQASSILQSCVIQQNSKNYQAWQLLIVHINHKQKVNIKQTYPQFFSIKNKLSKYFPPIQINFEQNQNSVRKLNICVPYPKVEPPQINPKFDENLLVNFSQDSIQRKPEAPWIIKQQNSIKFTDKMQNFSKLDIEQSQMSFSRKGGLLKQKLDQSDIMNYQQEQSYHCLKDKLKLDQQLQKKINKFISK